MDIEAIVLVFLQVLHVSLVFGVRHLVTVESLLIQLILLYVQDVSVFVLLISPSTLLLHL